MSFVDLQGDPYRAGMESARQLASHLRSGGALVPIRSGMRLQSGESEFTQTQAACSRYFALGDSSYTRSTFLGLGSFGALAFTALGSAAWNSHKRRKAERQAAPQWRPIGQVGVTVTSQRILMLQEMTWESIRFPQILQLSPLVEKYQLDILFEGAPAVRLVGPSVPFISVLLFFLLYGDVVVLPPLGTG